MICYSEIDNRIWSLEVMKTYNMWHWLCHQVAGRSQRPSKGLLLKAERACWPKTNRLPAIPLAMMGLFRIRRELKFRVSNHGKAHASPHRAREGERFYWGGEGSSRAIVKKESKAFHWLSPLPGKKAGLSSHQLCYCLRAWDLPFWSSNSI